MRQVADLHRSTQIGIGRGGFAARFHCRRFGRGRLLFRQIGWKPGDQGAEEYVSEGGGVTSPDTMIVPAGP